MSRNKFNKDNHSIGDRIRTLRKARKLTQAKFADSLGIAQGFLCEIEKGKYEPTKPLLFAIAYLYQINFDWLADGKGTMSHVSISPLPQNAKANSDINLIIGLLQECPEDTQVVLKLLKAKKEVREAMAKLER